MEIICAGYPKTGSKSCSSALRTLGYNVADFVETGAFLSEHWQDFCDANIGIEDVIGKGILIFKIENLPNKSGFENLVFLEFQRNIKYPINSRIQKTWIPS